ncbi:MAG: diguanylate cyclase [Sulfuritalea sp.]|nr:diguanylate cyclase [Sulfuritalea sp.]
MKRMYTELTVKEIVHADILGCAPATPLADAARRMVENHCSSILIEADGKAVGIWTEQDALALDITDGTLGRSPISEFMSAPVKTLLVDTAIGEAALRFREEGVRHFLVVDAAGGHRGIISQSDIVINQGIEYFISLREVKSVFNRRHLTVPGATPTRDAIREMRQGGFDAIVVTHAERGYGMFTERDVVRLVSSSTAPAAIGELASYPLITLPANASLFYARKHFLQKQIRHLGVTGDAGELLGLVTFADILANIEHEYVHHLREALRESKSALEISHRHLRLAAKAFDSTFEGIVVTNADNIIESVNPAFTRITGYSAQEVIGKTPAILASGRHDGAFYREMHETLANTGFWQGEICNRRRNGEIYVEWLTINAVADHSGKITNYVAVFSDFTSRKAVEDQIRFLAQHDALTRLPNRTLLRERLLRAILHARRNNRKLAVFFLDLDDFKQVNDSFGHPAGDHLLKVVAQRLADCVRAEDTVARLGGDEFVVVLEEIASAEGVPAIVSKLIDTLSQPMVFEGHEMRVSASIGISLYPDDGEEPDILVRNADKAMYQAKEKGGSNAFHFFAAEDI